MSSEQQLTSRGTHEPVEGTRKLVTKTTALTETRETEDTMDMDMEITPLQQQNPQGHISLHRSDSQNQPQKRAKPHPQGNLNYPSPKERTVLVDYQYYVRDTIQDLEAVPSDVHPTIVNSFNIPISRRSFTSMAEGQFLNDDIINWMQT
jgi:Ulp1 family protease